VGAAPAQQRPTLAFSWRGHNVTMVQELPIRWAGGPEELCHLGPASQPTPAAQRCYACRRPRPPQLLLAAPTCTLCNLPFLLVSLCTTHPPCLLAPGSLPLWCSQPYSQRDVEELARQRDISSLSPFYLDLQDEVLRIQASIGCVVWMCVFFCGCQAGQLGMQRCSSGMHRGSGPGQLAQS
jgi:hypothetical protein